MSIDLLTKCVNIVLNGGQLLQSRNLHKNEIKLAQELYHQNKDIALQQHIEGLEMNKKTYLVDLFITLEQHFQQLNADLVGSSRESERDMFDQRNQQLQTIILASSVMFSSLATVIIQGPLPVNSSPYLVLFYSLSSSLSFAALFISVVLSIEVVMRASKFMYDKSRRQTRNLKEAVDNTRDILRIIRNKAFVDKSSQRLSPSMNSPDDSKLEKIVSMNQDDLKFHWEKHENFVHDILERREGIIDSSAYQLTDTNNYSHKINAFDNFWNEKCKFWSDLATLSFYIGSMMLLVAIMIFMWAIFSISYLSSAGAILAVVIIGVSLVIGIAVGIYLRFSQLLAKRSKYLDDDSTHIHDIENGDFDNASESQ